MLSSACKVGKLDSARCVSKSLGTPFTPLSLSIRRSISVSKLNTHSISPIANINNRFGVTYGRNAIQLTNHISKYLFSDSQTKDDIDAKTTETTAETATTNTAETAQTAETADTSNDLDLEALASSLKSNDDTAASDTAADAAVEDDSVKVTYNEHIDTEVKQHSFQTETKQLLDIVAHSLYTDREVFLRELLSNSSDALEKTRYYLNTQSQNILDPERSLEISVYTDKDSSRLVIQDSGIGMSDQDLISNLGTIARSGSKAFVKAMKDGAAKNDSIIGQFGVGFYSIFMVCDKVEVYSRPAVIDDASNDKGFYWTSDGSGEYSIAEASNVERGTKIILHLKEDSKEFADSTRVENIIKKYSSFLEYDIKLNGKLMSSTGAIWSKQANSVTEEQYKDFYQMISDRSDDPYYTYHSHFDTSQFSAQCVLYVPEFSSEKFGGRQPSGVSLYCKKVLVSKNCQEIIPEWLRFLRGVIDCENIPIHISRENMQDSALMEQLKETVMTKMVDFLSKQAKKDSKKYTKWFKDFDSFIKEGVCTYNDVKSKEKICRLLRYEVTPGTSLTEGNEKDSENIKENVMVSFDQYLEALPNEVKEKKEIYYLNASNRESALQSPYIESFIDDKIPVLLCYQQMDEFIMNNISKYKDFKLVGIESANPESKDKDNSKDDDFDNSLTESECLRLGTWFRDEFPQKIEKCETTYRLKSHPCVLVDHTPQAIRQIMRTMGNNDLPVPPQTMQINPKHGIMKHLFSLIEKSDNESKNKAKVVAKQLINNAFIAAGIIDDARHVLGDINALIELALDIESTNAVSSGTADAAVVNERDSDSNDNSEKSSNFELNDAELQEADVEPTEKEKSN